MRNLRSSMAAIGLGLLLAGAAHPQDPHSLSYVGELWAAMDTSNQEAVAVVDKPIGRLLEWMIWERQFVCGTAVTMRGLGAFERGRFARVICQGDPPRPARLTYRVELWEDGDTYLVRPWDPLLDGASRN
jgi:hypothetical protein